jgi:hypothetical protein
MTQAFATRMPRGFSWVWLAIATLALWPASVAAQPPGDDKKPPVDEAKKDDPEPAPTEQVFVDPGAKKALTVFNPMNYNGRPIKVGGSGDDGSKIQNIASRLMNIDPDFMKNYIEFFTVELTKRENLNAVLNPPANLKPLDPASRALEKAVAALNKPIIDAKAIGNPEFLNVYERLLFESSLPKLLEPNHNYLSRIDAAIVLGMAGNPSAVALDLYINQIKKPDQLIWVKLWAARGLSIAAQEGEIDLDASKANQAAEALIGWLDSDPKLPWPAQMRALEALGSLRVATANTGQKRIDVASVAMRFLADPDASPMVRAWAAWALGVMKVPSGLTPYNFPLVGQEIGELVVDLGNRIVQEYDDAPADFDKQKDAATQLTSLLLFQVCPSLIGVERVRDSGLLRAPHKNAADARPFLTKLDDKVRAVTREAYDLLKTAGAGNKVARDRLDSKLADLKSYLAGTTPKDRHLVPGGPEFNPPPAEQVAGARQGP